MTIAPDRHHLVKVTHLLFQVEPDEVAMLFNLGKRIAELGSSTFEAASGIDSPCILSTADITPESPSQDQ